MCINCLLIYYRYNAHLKDAKKLGVKKGTSAGLGIGLTSFFIFFVHAVGFWFGAYLIQYQDATSGDILTVSNRTIVMHCECNVLYCVGVCSIVSRSIFSWTSCS